MKLSKKKLKTNEFSGLVLKEAEKVLPEGLSIEYMSSCDWNDPEDITDNDFWIETNTDWGGSEGIYTDIIYVREVRKDDGNYNYPKKSIGTVKTLDHTWEAMEKMAMLGVRIRKIAEELSRKYAITLCHSGYALAIPKNDVKGNVQFDSLQFETPIICGAKDLEWVKRTKERWNEPGCLILDLEKRTVIA